jgi:hypothetical protein
MGSKKKKKKKRFGWERLELMVKLNCNSSYSRVNVSDVIEIEVIQRTAVSKGVDQGWLTSSIPPTYLM